MTLQELRFQIKRFQTRSKDHRRYAQTNKSNWHCRPIPTPG